MGAKRLGLKIEAKRLGGKRLGGEMSCYQFQKLKQFFFVQKFTLPGLVIMIKLDRASIEEWNMHWPKLHFFSGFLSTMLLTFLSFSLFLMQQTPRAIVVNCDGSVYDVDVDNQINRFSLHIFSSSQMIGKIAYYFLKRHCLRVRYRTPRLWGYGSCTGLLDTDSRGPVLDSEPG